MNRERIEKKDPFAQLANEITRFCTIHEKETSHARIPGTDTYLCKLPHESNRDSGEIIYDDIPPGMNADSKRLQKT